ncbi:alanine racemase, catabolic [mine drainage metagenome]|jgi:alanine racemase|uniref:Alanine racemase, catabolic n=1 Tax=mine drainage metagenome TaxID=410659 RepID=A0A1J5PVA9_9ZZZZ
MPRPIQAYIHTDALAHNLQRARRAAAGAKVWAVVKANAYGHGLARVFSALRSADGFALLDLAEAETLRALGWGGPILLLEGTFGADDLARCERLNLWHTVHDAAQINWLAARSKPRAHRVFAKLNTGMNRLGFSPEQYRAAWQRLSQLPAVADIGHMTHFASADVDGGDDDARELFLRTVDGLPGEHSTCNSAALLRHGGDAARLGDWVRPGIMLYGSSPTAPQPDSRDWELRPTMSLCTRIIGVQQVAAGTTVGYGGTFRAPQPMRVGVAAIGYADGYPRHAPSGTPIVVDGVRTRTLGRVSMDMVMVDLDPVRAAGRAADVGSPVLCWGREPGAEMPIDEVAAAAGTLGYELMCALAPRVPVHVA